MGRGGEDAGMNAMQRTPRNKRRPSTHPQPCEPLLAGWMVGANGHVTRREGRGGEDAGTNATQRTPRNERRPSTRPQPCEPLLVGWMVGANDHVTRRGGEGRIHERTPRNEHHETNDNPAAAPSPASHCLRGGSWVLKAMSHDGEGRGGYANKHHVTNAKGAECTKTNKMNETTHPPPQHLPPRLWATACRMGNRCYGFINSSRYYYHWPWYAKWMDMKNIFSWPYLEFIC
jgi:hypothetical protein